MSPPPPPPLPSHTLQVLQVTVAESESQSWFKQLWLSRELNWVGVHGTNGKSQLQTGWFSFGEGRTKHLPLHYLCRLATENAKEAEQIASANGVQRRGVTEGQGVLIICYKSMQL